MREIVVSPLPGRICVLVHKQISGATLTIALPKHRVQISLGTLNIRRPLKIIPVRPSTPRGNTFSASAFDLRFSGRRYFTAITPRNLLSESAAMGVRENLVERRWLDSITSDRITGERLQGRRKGVIVFFLRRGYASRGVGVCLGLNGKSKEYRFQMRRWVLTYPYSHPRPPDDLLGASYPNPDIWSKPSPLRALLPFTSPGGNTPTLVRNIVSRPTSQKLIQSRHFAPSPFPSPFPFHRARYVSSANSNVKENESGWMEFRLSEGHPLKVVYPFLYILEGRFFSFPRLSTGVPEYVGRDAR